ncbi:hypothetical protein ACIP79_10360 [Streptomyces sp. NPDC088747]|uniref:hypothetical protein n=1 Tax=Streptomyces sp. NPDC088747 TaxID=3365886 RepID=UPI003824FAE2
MRITRVAALSAVAALTLALALAGGDWNGRRHPAGADGRADLAESLTGYDPADAGQVAATADDVFVAEVLETAGRRIIDDVDWDLYRVRVAESRKGDRAGTVRVAVEHGGPPLESGAAYVFATNRFPRPADGNGQVAEAAPRPAGPGTSRTARAAPP